jgi:hypothetical protein
MTSSSSQFEMGRPYLSGSYSVGSTYHFTIAAAAELSQKRRPNSSRLQQGARASDFKRMHCPGGLGVDAISQTDRFMRPDGSTIWLLKEG